MKTANPKSRYHLKISRKASVLEVGGGHNPHPRSNVVVDKYIDSNYHRHSNIKVLKNQEFIEADGENLPFGDNEFDYVICNQVLEHVQNPAAFLKEQMRVARSGYLETPSLIGEYLFPKESHKWLILELDNKLVLVEKDKYWFKTGLDFGFLFLTWLQKTSLGYKILMDTKPNFMTMRYEWNETIDFVISPDNPEYLKYFKGYWDEDMVREFFPQKTKIKEFNSATGSLCSIFMKAMRRGLMPRRD
jgi:ubiquinone/menaquinone biosynthesis C-methylase UbiE